MQSIQSPNERIVYLFIRWVTKAEAAIADWEDRSLDEELSDFSGGDLAAFADAGGAKAMRDCLQQAIESGLEETDALYYKVSSVRVRVQIMNE